MKIVIQDLDIAKTQKNKELIEKLENLVYAIDLMINAEIKTKTKIKELSLKDNKDSDILKRPDTDILDDLLNTLYDIKTDREKIVEQLADISSSLLMKYKKWNLKSVENIILSVTA